MEKDNYDLKKDCNINKFLSILDMYGNCIKDLAEAKVSKQNASTQAQIDDTQIKIDCAQKLILSAEKKIKKFANYLGKDELAHFLQKRLDNLSKLKAHPSVELAQNCGLIRNYVEAVVFSDDKMLEELISQNIFSLEKTLDYVNDNCISKGL